jgi:excisionase family DNA binding protein
VHAPVASRGIGVLSIGEAADRLGMSRSELEALIDRGAVEGLPTGYTRMIPTTEVERLQSKRGNP